MEVFLAQVSRAVAGGSQPLSRDFKGGNIREAAPRAAFIVGTWPCGIGSRDLAENSCKIVARSTDQPSQLKAERYGLV